MSYYILFYTCIQDIYFLISRFENKTFIQETSIKKHKNKRKRNNPISHFPVENKLLSETRELSSSLPSNLDNITSSLNKVDTENSNSNTDLNLISDNYSEFTDEELGLSNDELFTLELENDTVFWFGNNFSVLMLELSEFSKPFSLTSEGLVLDFMSITGTSFSVTSIW